MCYTFRWVCVCARACRCGCTRESMCLRARSRTSPTQQATRYCLRPLWLHQVFRHYLTNGTIFDNKSLNIKCAFWFFLQLLFETFLISKKTLARYRRKCENVFMSSTHYSSWKILKKKKKGSNEKFHQNPSSESRVVPCGRRDIQTHTETDRQTDRQTDMTKLLVAFHTFANAPKNLHILLSFELNL